VASQVVYSSPRFALAQERFATPDGEISRPIIHHPGAVGVIAQPDPQSLVLVRQYRYPIQRWTLEIPAGTRVHGEDPMVTAARELKEEAGYHADRFTELIRFYPAVGVSDEELILYRAEWLEDVPPSPEHGELVERRNVALSEVPALIASNEICDAKTLIAAALMGLSVAGVKAC
jgi:ADP-ribose pyrophosphatase